MSRGITHEAMARRVAMDIPDGSYVNLGIGLPTRVADFVPAEREVVFHSENGILGVGPPPASGEEDPELVNAGKELVSLVPGGSFFHHTDSFMMMRGGHLDYAVMGAFQVSADGDLANWVTDDPSAIPAVGGAMDLAVGASHVLIMTTHVTRDGQPKLLRQCTYPLTARGVVDRVYTELCVLDVVNGTFVVRELVEGVSEVELRHLTDAPLDFSGPILTLT